MQLLFSQSGPQASGACMQFKRVWQLADLQGGTVVPWVFVMQLVQNVVGMATLCMPLSYDIHSWFDSVYSPLLLLLLGTVDMRNNAITFDLGKKKKIM